MGIFLLVSFVVISMSKPMKEYLHIPKQIVMFEGEKVSFASAFPVHAEMKGTSHSVDVIKTEDSLSIAAKQRNDGQMILNMGGMPIKQVNVKILPSLKSHSWWTVDRSKIKYIRRSCCWLSPCRNGRWEKIARRIGRDSSRRYYYECKWKRN